ncbi:MAG: hypothetical protein FRX48_06926 [Lasallia pustulata]|uniref:Uncharacterized protein n=1 Tax=Lasallia pustulata TaxID=136370 RepID=A0A5M8PIY5_9LECA|nr:MAG: hypothetical protein FRX48_06926 [Lasallia pustulata]
MPLLTPLLVESIRKREAVGRPIQYRRLSIVVITRSLGQIEMHENALDTLSSLSPGRQRRSASPCCVHSIRPVGYFRLGRTPPLRYSCSCSARYAADEYSRSCARSSLLGITRTADPLYTRRGPAGVDASETQYFLLSHLFDERQWRRSMIRVMLASSTSAAKRYGFLSLMTCAGSSDLAMARKRRCPLYFYTTKKD